VSYPRFSRRTFLGRLGVVAGVFAALAGGAILTGNRGIPGLSEAAGPGPDLRARVETALAQAVRFITPDETNGRFNPTLRLLPEAPFAAPNSYWLFNDNALAAHALDRVGRPDLAQVLWTTIQQWPGWGKLTNGQQEVLWGVPGAWPLGNIRYRVFQEGEVLSTEHWQIVPIDEWCAGDNQTPAVCVDLGGNPRPQDGDSYVTFDDWAEYANLALYGALHKRLLGHYDEARRIFLETMTKFNGVGFVDKATSRENEDDPAALLFETYKVALALHVGLLLGRLAPDRAESMAEILLAKQAQKAEQAGGFHTHYLADGAVRGDVNTETTSLCVIGLHTYLTMRPRIYVPFVLNQTALQ
jgi:hypothetical protein